MTSSLKSLRYTTAIAVSLVAISTANQANAQCTPADTTGNNTITCNGTQNGTFSFGLGDDDLTNNGIIDGGAASALNIDSTLPGIGGSTFGGTLTNITGSSIISNSAAPTIIFAHTGDFNNVTNQGLIENSGAGVGVQFFFNSSVSDITGGITNSGTIRGSIGIEVGNSASSAPSGVQITGGINNSGTIEGTGGTAIIIGDAVVGATPININGGQIIGDVIDNNVANGFSRVTITGSGFDTEGDFTVSSLMVNAGQEFRISAGDTFNTRVVGLAGGSTVNFEVDAAGTAGTLNVTADAINLTGSAIGAEVDPAAALTDGQEIQIGTGTSALIGTTGAIGQALTTVTDDSLLFDFAIADGGQTDITGSMNANDLFFLVSQAASGATAGNSAITSNANNAGGTIEALMTAGTSDPQLSSILANVGAASTSEELEAVLQAVLPQIDTGSLSASQNVVSNTIRLVSDRLTTIRGTGGGASGISSGDITENLQLWTQVFGQRANQGFRDGIAGFDATTRGVTVGADTEGLHDNTTVGVAFSYAFTDVDSNNATNTQSDINSYNVTFYGDYDLDKNTYLVGDVGYTYGDNETTRSNIGGVAGLNADSDYGSHQVQARAIVARDYHPAQYDGVKVTPKAQARYTYYQNEDINETGAGGANLNVDSESLNILELGVGVDVRKDYVQKNGGILSPEISVGYRYDLIGDEVQTTSTFAAGGPSFRTEGADPDQDTFNIGVGVGYTAPNNMEFTASYDYENKDEFNAHSAFIRAAMPF